MNNAHKILFRGDIVRKADLENEDLTGYSESKKNRVNLIKMFTKWMVEQAFFFVGLYGPLKVPILQRLYL